MARARHAGALLLTLLLAACGGGGGDNNSTGDNDNHPQRAARGGGTPASPSSGNSAPIAIVDGDTWDETAVRKVLQVFAFGSFASDADIQRWADLPPEQAIVEIIDLSPFHPRLAPAAADDPIQKTDGSLTALGALWRDPAGPLPAYRRQYDTGQKDGSGQPIMADRFSPGAWRGAHNIYLQAASSRSLNPVRQRIVQWETNQHLAVNRRADVANAQLLYYYDQIANDLAAALPYQKVLARAAGSAAVARQYGHYNNRYRCYNAGGEKRCDFYGNEDFAREYHQLFFGILGTRQAEDRDKNYHEETTIKNTALALTGLQLLGSDGNFSKEAAVPTFNPQLHYVSALEILHSPIDAASAQGKLDLIAEQAIRHPESLDNLPLMIAGGLADDTLNDGSAESASKISELRALWQWLPSKNLVDFLRWYAISRQFHSPQRVKYWNPLERHLLIINRLNLNQRESDVGLYEPEYINRGWDDYAVFEPKHNVFGQTSGAEALNSADFFRQIYNLSSNESGRIYGYWQREGQYEYKEGDKVIASGERDYTALLPATDGYRTRSIAAWLWQRLIADGGKYLGDSEKLHVYSLLYYGSDPANVSDVAFQRERAKSAAAAIDYLASKPLDFANPEITERRSANARLLLAAAFINATPYAFLQEGR